MFFSERLLASSIYRPGETIEYKVYGSYNLTLHAPGIYDVRLVGAGGLTQGVYSGDWATGRWTGNEVATGGQGATLTARLMLIPGKYTIVVGALGGGTDLTSTYYTWRKTPGSSQGNLPISTYIINPNGTTILTAGGGGYAPYSYRGYQKNGGPAYRFDRVAYGGTCSKNIETISFETSDGANGGTSIGGDGGTSLGTSAKWNGYGRANQIWLSYGPASGENYCVSYTVADGTSGYCSLTYVRQLP